MEAQENNIPLYLFPCEDIDNYYCKCKVCKSALQHQQRRLAEYDFILYTTNRSKVKIKSKKKVV